MINDDQPFDVFHRGVSRGGEFHSSSVAFKGARWAHAAAVCLVKVSAIYSRIWHDFFVSKDSETNK
jgi:hypothetical protein